MLHSVGNDPEGSSGRVRDRVFGDHPEVVIRPMVLGLAYSVNHSAPSGPDSLVDAELAVDEEEAWTL
jgi:hypothetical protein